MNVIELVEREQMKDGVPEFRSGDTIRVFVKVVEGGKERIQMFEGVVIKHENGGLHESVTVRRVSQGVGIEREFLLHSPRIDKIEVSKRGIVRRARLYYLADRVGKAARIKERKTPRA